MHTPEQEHSQQEGRQVFWLDFGSPCEIDVEHRFDEIEDFLLDPTLTGNRLAGFHFARLKYRLILEAEGIVTDPRSFPQVKVRREGSLHFEAPIESLRWRGEKKEIWPLALLEYVVSAFRIARKIYGRALTSQDRVAVDLAMLGIRGWKLRPGLPRSWFELNEPAIFSDSDDFLLDRPVVFHGEEIESGPDRCGYRLVERVYEAFGLGRAAIPEEFNQKAGRLVLPE